MFNLFATEDPALKAAIADVYKNMETLTPDDPAYVTMVDQLEKLNSLKTKGVDLNQLIAVAGNLAVGVAVLKFERRDIVTTKVWSFLKKF